MMERVMPNSYWRHIDNCNPVITEKFIPWKTNGKVYGWLRHAFVSHLMQFNEVFTLSDRQVTLANPSIDKETLTEQLAMVVDTLFKQGVIKHRPMNEPYPITTGVREDFIAVIDRVAVSHFGILTYGQHLNGYVIDNGTLLYWIAKRAKESVTFPSAWDNMVAGGLPHGISMQENLIKECYEEAGVQGNIVNSAQVVSSISYNSLNENGLQPEIVYCYDIQLPANFIPHNIDGEVESFHLMPIDDILQIIRDTDDFKDNCNLVVIDFALRHNLISEKEFDLRALAEGLRQTPGLIMNNGHESLD